MDSISRSQLVALARLEAPDAVSIFVPSTHHAGGARQEPVRLRNLLRDARAGLAAAGLDAADAAELLAPLAPLEAADDPYWRAPAEGYAFFLAPGFFRPARLEFTVDEQVRVGSRFAVRPLLPLLGAAAPHYVLALSINRVRLLESGPDGLRPLALPALPASFDEAMGYVEYDHEVSLHASSGGEIGRRPGIFHGHGDGDAERWKEDVVQFFRRVVDALERELPEPRAPLVVASVAEEMPLFRRAARRLNLVAEGVTGNPDHRSDGDLAAAARPLVAAQRGRVLDAERARWSDLQGSGRSLGELAGIVREAERGSVETLLVAREAERWGTYEPDLDRLVLREPPEVGDEELLDRAAARTLARGGEVFELPLAAMPERRIVAATLRYPAAG